MYLKNKIETSVKMFYSTVCMLEHNTPIKAANIKFVKMKGHNSKVPAVIWLVITFSRYYGHELVPSFIKIRHLTV